jgi:hypothetical protein
MGKFDRYGKMDKDNESGHEESMEEDIEKKEQLEGGNEIPADATPIAAFHPSMGLVQVPISTEEWVSNTKIQETKQNTHEQILAFNPESQILVHGYDGPFVMDKCKWPTLTLPEEDSLGGLT